MLIRKTETYKRWFHNLKDRQARMRIDARLRRLSDKDHLGDYKVLSDGVMYLRIDYGPGYRIYCAQQGAEIILLLLGGDKRRESKDIEAACKMARELKGEKHD